MVHRAFESPNRVVRQVAEMPDGRRYLWIARTVSGRPAGFGAPTAEFSVALGCAVEHAGSLVYSDGLDLNDRDNATPIGAGCRVCDRQDGVQRAFPRSGHEVIAPRMCRRPRRTLQCFPRPLVSADFRKSWCSAHVAGEPRWRVSRATGPPESWNYASSACCAPSARSSSACRHADDAQIGGRVDGQPVRTREVGEAG